MIYLRSYLPFVVMGITSILLQITILRLLLSTFSGNELDIGITLSFWLIYVGLGSYIGRKIKLKHAFTFSFILIALLAQPIVIAIKAIRPVLSLEPGEIVSLTSTILSTAVSLFPLCLIIGLQFPLAVSYASGSNAAGRVYGIEALGAFIGGILFTFVTSSTIRAFELCLIVSLINIFMAGYVSKKKIITLVLIIPIFFYLGFYKTATVLPWHGLEISETAESRYGEITVIGVRNQSSVYANGHLIFTYPDLQIEEMSTHLPMALHPSPAKVLVIGGSLGSLKEFLKYPVDSLDFIELDPKIVEVSLRLLNTQGDRDAVKDRRVRIIGDDGRRFIKGLREPTYDLIVLNLPQPSTAGINRFYTSNFFKEAKGVLKDNGVFALTMPQSTGYIGRSMQTAIGAIYNSLRSVFRYVEVTAQEYGGLFASDSVIQTEPEILANRFMYRAIRTQYFHQYIFNDAFSSLNVDYVKKRLGDITFINTDLQPSAYLYNLMLWTEVHGGKLLKHLPEVRQRHIIPILVITLFGLSFYIFRRKRRIISYSIFTTGYSGMSFTIAVLLIYQAIYGYVYEMIGMLTATFMVGLWLGTILTRNLRKAFMALFYLELMTITLAFISPLFFESELLFYILILLAGILTGGQFSAANISMDEKDAAGKLYGLELFGSFLGAFIPSMICIPLFGVSYTLLFVAVIKIFSAAMILSFILMRR